MKIEMIVTGDERINRALKKISGKEAKGLMRKSMRPALKPVLQEAKSNAPSDTGQLKKNIKIKAMKRSRSSFGMRVSMGRPGQKDNTGKAFYGAFLELGTQDRATQSGANRGTIKRRDFIRNAYKTKQDHAYRIYRTLVTRGIRRIAAGA